MDQRDVNNLLPRLQRWYSAQCDGDWEHHYGVKIDTLDNPGWLVKIDLVRTSLEHTPFQEVREATDEDGWPQAREWLHCNVVGGVWEGAGDSTKLARILELFLGGSNKQDATNVGRVERSTVNLIAAMRPPRREIAALTFYSAMVVSQAGGNGRMWP